MHASASIEIRPDSDRRFAEYASISTAFEVRERVDVSTLSRDASTFATCPVSTPWTKDYDAVAGNAPTDWPARFRVDAWLVFRAFVDSHCVGAAILASDAGAVANLGGRIGAAILWDLRVLPDMRGRGIGRALLRHVERVAADAGCRWLYVETQDINVAACRLYAAAGYDLLDITLDAYSGLPGEAGLTWIKELRKDFL